MGNKRNFVDSIAVVHGVYDARGQLLAVRENGADVERYAYDRAGNMVRKTVRGRTTTYAFDGANQLVSSTCDGVTTRYAYDAAGRLVREGDKTYRYGYLDKVLSVTDRKRSCAYAYHVDGQLARADYGDGGRAGVGEDGRAGSPLPAGSEAFLWDGLALVRRGDESFVNEPHVGGGNPVVSSRGATYFNDALGTTVGVREGRGASRKKSGRRYTAAALTAFGEPVPVAATAVNAFRTSPDSNIRRFDHSIISSPFFTGKPEIEGLGRVFLYRNYRADLAKWQTADPLGYPDGWNHLKYGVNSPLMGVDLLGASWGNMEMVAYYFRYAPEAAIIASSSTWLATAWWAVRLLTSDDYLDTDVMGLTDSIFAAMKVDARRSVGEYVKNHISGRSGSDSRSSYNFGVDCESIVFALGGGNGRLLDKITWSWYTERKWVGDHLYEYKHYEWSYSGAMKYSDSFEDPVDVLNWLKEPNIEVPGGVPYRYGHIWQNVSLSGSGVLPRMLE